MPATLSQSCWEMLGLYLAPRVRYLDMAFLEANLPIENRALSVRPPGPANRSITGACLLTFVNLFGGERGRSWAAAT